MGLGADIFAVAIQRPKLGKDIKGLPRERYQMLDIINMDLGLAPHFLHALGRDDPERVVNVELLPLGANQLIGSDEGERQQFEPKPGNGLARIVVDCPKQLRQFTRLDCRAVLLDMRRIRMRRSAAAL